MELKIRDLGFRVRILGAISDAGVEHRSTIPR